MHNEFYASGFLYHPPTQQILLQQHSTSDSLPPVWTLFGGKNKAKETPELTFHRILNEDLGLSVSPESCYSVYDYVHKEKKIPHFIHYAVTEELLNEEALLTEHPTEWFTFKQITKLPIAPQTKQDIIVGQRVINLAIRELLPPTPNPES